MHEIVSSEANSVDVDKFDYISRDSYNVGIKTLHFDSNRLIESCAVLDHKVCYHSKNDYNIYGLFQSRYKLFKDVYTHRLCNAINFMIADALLAADCYYHFLEMIRSPALFATLTDCFLHTIEHSTNPVRLRYDPPLGSSPLSTHSEEDSKRPVLCLCG